MEKESIDVLLHLWHKFLWLYGEDNCVSTTGALHTRKIKVLCEVIDLFLSISHKEVKVVKGSVAAPFVHSPEGNKLMELFGEWLLEACEREDK